MFDAPVADSLQESPSLAPQPGATATHAALLAPRLSLASCIRAYLTRSTLGADLSLRQRHNHFPASPYCSIMWIVHGDSTRIRLGDTPLHQPLTALSFIGSHTEPCVSVNQGPAQVFMAILMPQAVQALTGIDLASLVNRVVPMEEVFGTDWLAMAQAVQQANDDHTRVQLMEAFLEPRWSAVREQVMPRADRQRYWVEGLALRAATSGMGKSLRQMERRIKDWAGLPLRDLRRLTRSEEVFVETRDTYLSDTATSSPNWADIASDGGFSDQSHLCRETRRVCGLSPNELKRALKEEESFWVYRIWD
ncbi:MAG: helix-turn-helix domain-containing protein [Pseudomonadota bacterium]